MTDKEILAELKTAYLNLEDIIDNSDLTQINKSMRKGLISAQVELMDIYEKLWNETQEDITIKGENDLTIGKQIYTDYYDVGNDEYISKTEIIKNGKEYAWWEDYDFLLK